MVGVESKGEAGGDELDSPSIAGEGVGWEYEVGFGFIENSPC